MEGQPKLKRASVSNAFKSDRDEESTLEHLMIYPQDCRAAFVGLERMVGRIGNRSGAFVLHHEGAFEHGTAWAPLTIVPDSATGDLAELHGTDSFTATRERPTPVKLEYGFN